MHELVAQHDMHRRPIADVADAVRAVLGSEPAALNVQVGVHRWPVEEIGTSKWTQSPPTVVAYSGALCLCGETETESPSAYECETERD